MSSKNGQHERRGSNAPSSGTGGSRKSSTVNVAATKSALQHATGLEESAVALSDLEPVNFGQLCSEGSAYLDDPPGGRAWLLAFGHFQEDTYVSLRLRCVGKQPEHNLPSSILPLLTAWVPSWYKLAAAERRQADKQQKPHPVIEYDWLLQYIADYVNLSDDFLDDEEVSAMFSAVLDMAQLTTSTTDIDMTVTIIHRLAMRNRFPKDLIDSTLEFLVTSMIIFSKSPPAAISESFNLFLMGDMRDHILDKLLEFVVTPTYQNKEHKLILGRGALRQLSSIIDLTDSSDELVVNTSRFIDALDIASTSCIFRLCTEVLCAYHEILNSRQAEKILHEDFQRVLDAIKHCIQTVAPRNSTSRSPIPTQSPDRDQVLKDAQQTTKHLAERNHALRNLLADFEQAWPMLSDFQQKQIRALYMEHAKDLSDGQAALVISTLEPMSLADTSVGDIGLQINATFDCFIRNSKVSSENRVLAMKYCIDVARSLIMTVNQSSEQTQATAVSTGKHIIDRILNTLNNEYDNTIVRHTITLLTEISFATKDGNSFPYVDLIVRKLTWLIKNERNEDEDAERGVLYTCGIRELFLRGFQSAAPIALKAFEALLEIADVGVKSRGCRLAALRLLVRLRSDASGMLYLQTETESEYIAAALCRTDEARKAFASEVSSTPRTSNTNVQTPYLALAKQLWSYPAEFAIVLDWPTASSTLVSVKGHLNNIATNHAEIRMSDWLFVAIRLFQNDTEWETLSFMLVHFGAQLFNTMLFNTSLESIVKLRQILCDQIVNGTFREPPASTGLRRSDAALCMFNVLTGLIPYATLKSEHIQKGFGDDLVKAFLSGIGGQWDGTSRGCIHALGVCSFEMPASVASQYPNIVTKMSKSMTQSHLTIHILEFLAQVARLPEVHSNFNQDEITMIFGICLQFLEKAREQHTTTISGPSPRSGTPARHSGVSLRRTPYRAAMVQDLGLPQYASALAYHTMIFWFLSLKLEVRAYYVSWIVPRLIWQNSNGDDSIDEQSQVFIDFMQRTAYSDLGETEPDPNFATPEDGSISSASWIVGLSIITTETAGYTGKTQITKRQAAGTTYAVYQQRTAPLPHHHVPTHTEIRLDEIEEGHYGSTLMLPPHPMLQMVSSAAPISLADQPLRLPKEDYVTRALAVFDRIPTVDSHKLGVIYVDKGQIKDTDFLANSKTSRNFDNFLAGLGYVVSLQEPLEFKPQGLQYPRDGATTVAWRDRVTEIVYHVPTMMPNDSNDPSCNTKKSHVGNCHVVIIFNESGLPWKMENFPSAVTFVHVVITPANHTNRHKVDDAALSSCQFFHVHVLTKDDHPNVTSASDPKVISRDMLPGFVRMLALSASVFSQAKVADDSDDNEFPSTWRTRLQHIKMLKKRVIDKSAANQNAPTRSVSNVNLAGLSSGRRTPIPKDDGERTGQDEERDGTLAVQLDFGRWTL